MRVYPTVTHSRDTSLQTVHYSTKYYVQLSTDHFEGEKKGSGETRHDRHGGVARGGVGVGVGSGAADNVTSSTWRTVREPDFAKSAAFF